MAAVAQADRATLAPTRRRVQIVPLGLLPVVAVVLVGLIVAIATNSQWALDFYHVAGGGLWTGLDLFLGLVLGPIMGTMSVAARIEFSSRLMPKMLLIMPVLVTMTLGSGLRNSKSTARFAGSSSPSAITAITPTTM